jgi:Fe-S cluster biogenesis protein NfuA
MHAERTPNPHSIKWVVGCPVAPGGTGAHFETPPAADVSPLAASLFSLDGVRGVFLGSDFVTVTKREDAEWLDLAQPIVDRLREHLASGAPALGPAFAGADVGAESEVVVRIRRVLEDEVRPAVAMDGGDVVFSAFRDGVVELYLRGSCSGCPGSETTLRNGIEARLREAIPEVQGVVAL